MTRGIAGRWVWMLVAVVALRVATLGLYPLSDPTEGRYAEVARKMVSEGGSALMPETLVSESMDKKAGEMVEKYGREREGGGKIAPFWAKPPLSSWFAAFGMKVFGENTIGVRMGSVIAFLLAVLGLGYWRWGNQGDKGKFSWDNLVMGGVIMGGCLLGFVASGAVMTDMAMCMGLVWAMVGMGNAARMGSERRAGNPGGGRYAEWGWMALGGAGAAAAVMAKGPVALVLVLASVGVWAVLSGRWKAALLLPWWVFGVVCGGLAAPWYVAAELATPGYLEYFLMGEHVQRFLQPGWQGDYYGAGHTRARGVIWLYALVGCCPWVLIWIAAALARKKSIAGEATLPTTGRGWLDRFKVWREVRPGAVWLWGWILGPLLFFTVSRNILPAYALPALAPFALLAVDSLRESLARKWVLVVAWSWFAFAGVGGTVAKIAFQRKLDETSALHLLEHARCTAGDPAMRAGGLLVVGDAPYSLEFYAKGQFRLVRDAEQARAALSDPAEKFVLVPKNKEKQLKAWLGPAAGEWRRATRPSGKKSDLKSKDAYLWERVSPSPNQH